MKNEIYLDFCIWGFDDINHNDITNILGITPSRVYIKGEKVNLKFSKLAEENGWRMSSQLGPHTSFEEQMDELIKIIESKIELFKPFCEKYYCEFSCALFIYSNSEDSTPWVHLNSKYNKLIKELNIEFDLDIYNK